MATIKRSLSKKRALNGKSEILLRVNINHGQQVRLKSTLFINPEYYDADQNKIKKGKPGSAIFMELHQLNKTLEALESHICDMCISIFFYQNYRYQSTVE